MSQPDDFSNDDPTQARPLDLSKWRNLPGKLMLVGALVTVGGAIFSWRHDAMVSFGFFWLVAFMFFLSIGLGALFLVIIHHLFDAGWSVPMRRLNEHIATLLFPWLAILFIPVLVLAPKLYQWMQMTTAHTPDHALTAKAPLFTFTGFYVVAIACFGAWWMLSNRLRYWSLRQDETGAAQCTHKMRFYSYIGIWLFALTLTFGAIMWMKALQHQWFSTMYGVQYFAGSVWLTLITVYVITMLLDRQRVLSDVLHEHQYYFLGSLFFAFTVFYAYVSFSQYFIIWNANMPEETFWFVVREKGTWFLASLIIIFGHFFLPFLGLLRIDVKSNFRIMSFFCAWAWLMHFNDMCFNILPVRFPNGFPLHWLWLPLGIMALMGGFLADRFLKKFASAAPFPIKDPRLIEAMGLYHPVPTQISGGELDQTDTMHGSPVRPKGGH
ncbi:MAG: hypothetical protein EXS35_14690 [Pedosphaera sp.]|nr:hypothetical protein [Pedosphaera sp.]